MKLHLDKVRIYAGGATAQVRVVVPLPCPFSTYLLQKSLGFTIFRRVLRWRQSHWYVVPKLLTDVWLP
jgi:hypothetical protein